MGQELDLVAAYAINDRRQIIVSNGFTQFLLAAFDDCAADFNGDGSIDVTDVRAFFKAWSTGNPFANVIYNGEVDGSDIDPFYRVWSSGGC